MKKWEQKQKRLYFCSAYYKHQAADIEKEKAFSNAKEKMQQPIWGPGVLQIDRKHCQEQQ